MRLLLDTHALIWALGDNPKLSRVVRDHLSSPDCEAMVSAASIMELFTKHRLGKLPEADGMVTNWDALMAAPGYTYLQITPAHARVAGAMAIEHKDPFDRLLIAQALIEGVPMATKEALFDGFGVERIW